MEMVLCATGTLDSCACATGLKRSAHVAHKANTVSALKPHKPHSTGGSGQAESRQTTQKCRHPTTWMPGKRQSLEGHRTPAKRAFAKPTARALATTEARHQARVNPGRQRASAPR